MTMKLNLVLITLFIFVTGCTTAKIYSSGNQPIYMNEPPKGNYKILRHFQEKTNLCLDYTGAFDLSPTIRKVLQDTNGDAVINVQWKTVNSPGDIALNVVSLGIAHCRDVVVDGDVIKWTEQKKE